MLTSRTGAWSELTLDHPQTEVRLKGVRGFEFGGRGLSGVLGSLELDVMKAIWKRGPAATLTIREVHDDLNRRRDISFNAVMTVMNRLVDKRLLNRKSGSGRSLIYTARMDRDSFEQRVSAQLAQALVRDFGSTAVAQFVDALDRADPERLEELKEALKRRGRKQA